MAPVRPKGANGHFAPTLKPVRRAPLRSSKTKSLFPKQKRGPQLDSLRACNKAAVAFKKCGFVSHAPTREVQLVMLKKKVGVLYV
jgi:hypothetical protein